MRVQLAVAQDERGWTLKRGQTVPQRFAAREAALKAAEAAAHAAVEQGDSARIVIVGSKEPDAERVFLPDHALVTPGEPPSPYRIRSDG